MSFQIWGVINLTPDSFYSGSRFSETTFLPHVENALKLGVDVFDIGAESTRPFAKQVSLNEEWSRLKHPLLCLKKEYGNDFLLNRVSIDTRKSDIAKKSIELGVGTINDTGGLSSEKMSQIIAEHQRRVVIMHSQGEPSEMQINPSYENLIQEVLTFLKSRSIQATTAGILPKNIIWDYGIGFGKRVEDNFMLLKNTKIFKNCGYPLMVGLSRKSFIGKVLKLDDPDDRGVGSLILHVFLALQNVDILRVHDFEETRQLKILLEHLRNNA